MHSSAVVFINIIYLFFNIKLVKQSMCTPLLSKQLDAARGWQAMLSHPASWQAEVGHSEGGVTCLLCMSDMDDNIWIQADFHPAKSTEFRLSLLVLRQAGMIHIIISEGPTVLAQLVHIPQRINASLVCYCCAVCIRSCVQVQEGGGGWQLFQFFSWCEMLWGLHRYNVP